MPAPSSSDIHNRFLRPLRNDRIPCCACVGYGFLNPDIPYGGSCERPLGCDNLVVAAHRVRRNPQPHQKPAGPAS